MIPIIPLLATCLQGPRIVLPKGGAEAFRGFYGSPADEGYDLTVLGRGAMSGVEDLRKRRLPKGSAELRLWSGFGPSMTEAYLFAYDGRRWKGSKLLSALPWYKSRRYRVELPVPKAGWRAFWGRLEGLGAWTLPDWAGVPTKGHGTHVQLDGIAYFVETQRNGVYHAYSYVNPQDATSPQARRFVAITRYAGSQFPPDPAWPKDWKKRLGWEEKPVRKPTGGGSQITIPGEKRGNQK